MVWIGIFLSFGPIIYLIVNSIVDSISYNAKESRRNKLYGEEEIIYVTTYQNNNIKENDIMLLFVSQLKMQKQHYYIIDYKTYSGQKEQNYAWSIKTTKQTFGWGIIYNIRFHFSNGWVYLSFSNSQFSSGGQSSQEYYLFGYDFGSREIEDVLDTCKKESRIKWKMNSREPIDNLPFNFDSLIEDKNRKQKPSSKENSSTVDLLSFYRNLLGLRLRFSQIELKNAYREAVGKYHPDRYGTSSPRDRENAEMLMKQVNEAYEKLKAVAE